MAKTFILHDESVNTYGFRMLISGADLSDFRKNPIMLLDHNDWNLPIGRWENIRVKDGQILADAVFDMKDDRARQVAGKVEDNFLRACSIGAWPPEEFSDSAHLKYPGQTGPTITKWKVREASIVTIGANHNALVFYDKSGKMIDMKDNLKIIRLFDQNGPNNQNSKKMGFLSGILNLADTATDAEVSAAVRNIVANNDRLKAENVTLTDRIDELGKQEKEKRKAEAVALVDAAVKDGRIDAKAKENYITLFDKDFDSAKAVLESIPVRQSVTGRIEAGVQGGAVELADFQKKTWEEIDKAEKLTMLRDKYPDLYKEKFKERYGCDPK
jgi:regulator of replication initiation timing